MKTETPKPHKQFTLPPQAFDGYNKELPIQEALGSARSQAKREAADIRSVNFEPGVSGWRLTPQGLELGNSGGVFPPGTITFTDIQNISTDKILGRDTAGSGVIEQLGLSGLTISGGNLVNSVTQYTDELAQDAVGTILTDTNSIDFIYTDATPTITADVRKQNSSTVNLTIDASGLKADTVPGVVPIISSGAVAPASTPTSVGDIYVDTVAKKIYVATGVASSADWTILN